MPRADRFARLKKIRRSAEMIAIREDLVLSRQEGPT